MCGRTSLFVPVPELEDRFDAEATPAVESAFPRYNVAPGSALAVVTSEAPEEIRAVEWGLVPRWADDPSERGIVNARAETLEAKPAFEQPAERRRCLVLADGFYEWKSVGKGKQPYRITVGENEPFAMAGLWERWAGGDRTVTTTTIVTTEPNDVLRPIHDRMPVVLDPGEESAWLAAGTRARRRELLDPYDGDDMRAYPVSDAVNDPANDRPGVVEPAEERQAGLDDFAPD